MVATNAIPQPERTSTILCVPSQRVGIPISEDSFRTICTEHAGVVRNCVLRLGVPSDDLHDVLQNVMLAVWESRSVYDPQRPLKPWILHLSYLAAMDYFRASRRHRRATVEVPEVEDPSSTADVLIAEAQDRALILAAIDQIPVERRRVFVQNRLEEKTTREIAEELGVSPNTISSRLRLADEEFYAAVRRIQAQRGERRPQRTP